MPYLASADDRGARFGEIGGPRSQSSTRCRDRERPGEGPGNDERGSVTRDGTDRDIASRSPGRGRVTGSGARETASRGADGPLSLTCSHVRGHFSLAAARCTAATSPSRQRVSKTVAFKFTLSMARARSRVPPNFIITPRDCGVHLFVYQYFFFQVLFRSFIILHHCRFLYSIKIYVHKSCTLSPIATSELQADFL